jgi:hypothetical protein
MITAIALSIALSTSAPVQVQVKSDSIPSAIQVKAVEFNRLTKDTITQITWVVFGLSRDTTQGCNSYVVAYDRKGRKVTDGNVPIPAHIVQQWGTDNTLIDDFILKFYNLIKR